MNLILPPGLSRRRFNQALAAFRSAIGAEWVLATDEDRHTYVDLYAPGDAAAHAPAAAIAPADVAQVQAVVRIANQYRIPLWPISRGKNFGYGGASPRMPGTVVLDMGRMNRILEVNERLGYCIVEPGVGFYDLYDYVRERGIALQLGIPGNGWGSVMGNALERGFSAAGDHSNNICGLEMVLADGKLVRTGMGAMQDGKAWPLFKHGYGPSWDQFIVQSNLAIVTKMCLWMKPEDELAINVDVKLVRPEDLAWYVEAITPLRQRGVMDGLLRLTSYMGAATVGSTRREWYTGAGALPDEVIGRIRERFNVGWWNGGIRIAGHAEVCEANLRIVQQRLAQFTQQEFPVTRAPGAQRSGPTTLPLQIVNWYGGRGGHIGFSPAMPCDGQLMQQQFERTRRRYQEFGCDYSGTFYFDGRSATNVNLILYDLDDADMKRRVRELFLALIRDAHEQGYGEYRTHLSYMDDVAETFDFNGHALRALNERVKDALDPRGIIAPGRNGIWPAAFRSQRGKL
ncbi:MAG: FAD-dependent oxidoreductase [Pseudomonadota bacterium]|nr:FAD-dependent oxidoreductase [Pseudomonadota bacterium]